MASIAAEFNPGLDQIRDQTKVAEVAAAQVPLVRANPLASVLRSRDPAAHSFAIAAAPGSRALRCSLPPRELPGCLLSHTENSLPLLPRPLSVRSPQAR